MILLIVIVLFFLGLGSWFFSTVAAGGAATLLIPVLGFIVAAEMIAPSITVAALFANPTRALLFRHDANWQVIRFLVTGSITGALVGAYLFTQVDAQWLQILIGVFLISTVAQYRFGKSRRSFPMKLSWFFPLGFIVAFISGLIGAAGPVYNPFMLNYGLEKEALVATKAINSLIMQISKLLGYGIFGALTLNIGIYGVAIGLGAMVGIYLAKKHLLTINEDRFRQYTLILMPLCGVALIIKAFS